MNFCRIQSWGITSFHFFPGDSKKNAAVGLFSKPVYFSLDVKWQEGLAGVGIED